MWIALGLEAFSPSVVAWLRLLLGAAALAVVPRARRVIDRVDWPRILVVAVAGNAVPALLFALAEQTVETSVAGMVNGAVPLFTMGVGLMLGQRELTTVHIIGLGVGFTGVGLLSLPNVTGESAPVLGVVWLILAVLGYGISNNVVVPLQQKYGGLAVIMWAQTVGVVLLTPFGLAQWESGRVTVTAVVALVILGVFGTGIARVVNANLSGRVGAQRASVVGYLVPVTAIIIGIAVRNESVSAWEFGGLALILASAYLLSRAVRN